MRVPCQRQHPATSLHPKVTRCRPRQVGDSAERLTGIESSSRMHALPRPSPAGLFFVTGPRANALRLRRVNRDTGERTDPPTISRFAALARPGLSAGATLMAIAVCPGAVHDLAYGQTPL